MALMNVLAELHSETNLKLTLKFEIEVRKVVLYIYDISVIVESVGVVQAFRN